MRLQMSTLTWSGPGASPMVSRSSPKYEKKKKKSEFKGKLVQDRYQTRILGVLALWGFSTFNDYCSLWLEG